MNQSRIHTYHKAVKEGQSKSPKYITVQSNAFDKVKAHKPETKVIHDNIIRRVMGADPDTQRKIYDYLKPIYASPARSSSPPMLPVEMLPTLMIPSQEVTTPVSTTLPITVLLVPQQQQQSATQPPPPQPPPPPPPQPPHADAAEAATLLVSLKERKPAETDKLSTPRTQPANISRQELLKEFSNPIEHFVCYGQTVYYDVLFRKYSALLDLLGSESAPRFWHRLAVSVGISAQPGIASDAARRVHQQLCARFNMPYIPAPHQLQSK